MDPDPAARLSRAWVPLFAALWAVAGLFHVWVSARGVGFFDDPTWVGASHLAVAAAAIAVLLRPHTTPLLLVLCAVELWSVWLELPVIGNHWVLVGLVDVGVLLAAATGSVGRALPAARWTLLGFYAFAAFAKLNAAFFDPEVSCGAFYFRETAASLRLERLAGAAAGDSLLAWAVVVGTAVVELSVPVLLLVRRTRAVGVVVGLAFHGLIALDQAHPFSDFSAALAALFVLFLPAGFAPWVGRVLDERVRRWLLWGAAVGAAGLTGLRLARPTAAALRVFNDGRSVAWVLFGGLALGTAVAYVWQARGERAEGARASVAALAIRPGWLAVVPVLAVLNGFTPYLELKTAFGWNMYSNLVTVDGDSNHFLVRATLPLTEAHRGLVRVVESSDPGLRLYVEHGYDLPWMEFREYLSRHPDASVTYQRAGVTHVVGRAGDDPRLVQPVSLLHQKALVFRAVDQQDPPRCQPFFLPAH